MKKRVTHGDLAQALGLNVRHVRPLIRAGMPAGSVVAARKWREANIAGGTDASASLGRQANGGFHVRQGKARARQK